MLCPKCHDQILVVVDRDGIEIDYCGGCRGVWLDRGELDKFLARATASDPAYAASDRRSEPTRYRGDDDDDDDRRSRRGRRGGFLGELFDFD